MAGRGTITKEEGEEMAITGRRKVGTDWQVDADVAPSVS
jgi:hypothetical protein